MGVVVVALFVVFMSQIGGKGGGGLLLCAWRRRRSVGCCGAWHTTRCIVAPLDIPSLSPNHTDDTYV